MNSIGNDAIKYSAYFSFCHETDSDVAEELSAVLRAYKIPPRLRDEKNLDIEGIGDIYCNTNNPETGGELNKEEKLALSQSRYLVVFCSLRGKNNPHLIAEIQEFIRVRPKENILAVLVSGEPCESFPDILNQTMIEPLATDIRGEDRSKAIKEQYQKLLAPLLGLEYDDLVQRHRARRNRHIRNIALLVAGMALFFAVFSGTIMAVLSVQKNKLGKDQAVSLAQKAQTEMEQGNRKKALEYAYSSLTSSDGIELPVTPEGQDVLMDILDPYGMGIPRKAKYAFEPKGKILDVKVVFGEFFDVACVYDSSDTYTVIDVLSGDIVFSLDGSQVDNHMVSFGNNGLFFYYVHDNNLVMFNIPDREESGVYPIGEATYLKMVTGNNWEQLLYTIAEKDGQILFLDNDYQLELNYCPEGEIFFSDDDNYFGYKAKDEQAIELVKRVDTGYGNYILDLEENEELIDIAYDNDCAYLLLEQKEPEEEAPEGQIIACYSFEDEDYSWLIPVDDTGAREIELLKNGDSSVVCAVSDYSAIFLNCENGSVNSHYSNRGKYAGITRENGSENMLGLFNSKGNILVYELDEKGHVSIGELVNGYFWDIKESDISEVISAGDQGWILVNNAKDNHIVVYGGHLGEMEQVASDEVTTSPKAYDMLNHTGIWSRVLYNEAYKRIEIRRYGLKEETKYIFNVQHVKGTCIDVITYMNNTVKIGNCLTGKIVSEWKDTMNASAYNYANNYWGRDRNGNYYIDFGHSSAVLNSKYEHIGDIPLMRGISRSGDVIYLGNKQRDEWYAAPVYTLDRLLEMAETELEKYESD